MRHLALEAALLLAMIPQASTAQQKPKNDADYDIKRCAPKSPGKRVTSGGTPPAIHWRKGEKLRHSPVVVLEILASGEVSDIRLKRSSGVADIDKFALDKARRMK
jgi:hypothetical protein